MLTEKIKSIYMKSRKTFGKRIKNRKRHILMDTIGLVLAVIRRIEPSVQSAGP